MGGYDSNKRAEAFGSLYTAGKSRNIPMKKVPTEKQRSRLSAFEIMPDVVVPVQKLAKTFAYPKPARTVSRNSTLDAD